MNIDPVKRVLRQVWEFIAFVDQKVLAAEGDIHGQFVQGVALDCYDLRHIKHNADVNVQELIAVQEFNRLAYAYR